MSSPYVPLIDSSNEMPLIVRKKASPNRCKIVVFLIGLIIFVYFASSDGFWQYFEERNLKSTTKNSSLQDCNSKISNKQESKNECDEIDYDEVVRMNSHELPKRTWSYGKETGICEGKNEKNCVPKLLHVKHSQYFWTSKTNKILGCTIKKNMSQVLQAILCFLNNELKFLYGGKDLIRDVFHRGCSDERMYSIKDAYSKRGVSKENGWSYLTIVRDPVDRFLSVPGSFKTWMFSGEHLSTGCVYQCHGCKQNMTCYLEKQYEKIRKMSKSVDKEGGFDHPTEHSYPQSWRCNFRDHLDEYTILHYRINSDEFYPVIRDFLETRNVSRRALDYIGNKMTSIRTSHSTVMSSVRPFLEERLRSSSYLMELILKTYFHDFKLFNFTLPEIPQV